jgi:HNH endonuclease
MILYTNKYRIPFEIDAADVESVSRYTWHIDHDHPATTIRWIKDGTYVLRKSGAIGTLGLRLRIFLLGKAPEGQQWDHKNRDPLDNRRENLRAVTPLVNARNLRLSMTNTSGVTGVYKRGSRWEASIYNGERNIHLGSFATLEEAAQVRKAAEARFWGEER